MTTPSKMAMRALPTTRALLPRWATSARTASTSSGVMGKQSAMSTSDEASMPHAFVRNAAVSSGMGLRRMLSELDMVGSGGTLRVESVGPFSRSVGEVLQRARWR